MDDRSIDGDKNDSNKSTSIADNKRDSSIGSVEVFLHFIRTWTEIYTDINSNTSRYTAIGRYMSGVTSIDISNTSSMDVDTLSPPLFISNNITNTSISHIITLDTITEISARKLYQYTIDKYIDDNIQSFFKKNNQKLKEINKILSKVLID